MAPQVVPSTEATGDTALPVWPAGVCDPMMAALPGGRLLLARIKHIPGPQASPARNPMLNTSVEGRKQATQAARRSCMQ